MIAMALLVLLGIWLLAFCFVYFYRNDSARKQRVLVRLCYLGYGLVVLVAVSVFGGCEFSIVPVVDACYDDYDCAAEQFCSEDGFCSDYSDDAGCYDSRDCYWGDFCAADGYCYVADSSAECYVDKDCPGEEWCSTDGRCYLPECYEVGDCSRNEYCSRDGFCEQR